jgi:hypothetical protein
MAGKDRIFSRKNDISNATIFQDLEVMFSTMEELKFFRRTYLKVNSHTTAYGKAGNVWSREIEGCPSTERTLWIWM